jgi:hypothetical protein
MRPTFCMTQNVTIIYLFISKLTPKIRIQVIYLVHIHDFFKFIYSKRSD